MKCDKADIFIHIILISFTVFLVIFKCISGDKYSFRMCKNMNTNYQKELNEVLNDYELIKKNYDIIPAEIINVSLTELNNIFMINKGYKDGVKKGALVVNESGLVGTVIKNYKNFSYVELISSKNSSIAIEIDDCYGFLQDGSKKEIVDLINCDNVKKGDGVFTSRYNSFSSNIYIGKVERINKDKITIRYGMNIYKLKYVGVINDNN